MMMKYFVLENRDFFCSILFRTIDNLHICIHDNSPLFFCLKLVIDDVVLRDLQQIFLPQFIDRCLSQCM